MFMNACNEHDIPCSPLYTSFPTITKQRFIEKTYHQQMLRVDYEERIELASSEQDSLLSVIESLKPRYLVVSDYNKGTIDSTFIQKLMSFTQKHEIDVLVDCKPQHMSDFT